MRVCVFLSVVMLKIFVGLRIPVYLIFVYITYYAMLDYSQVVRQSYLMWSMQRRYSFYCNYVWRSFLLKVAESLYFLIHLVGFGVLFKKKMLKSRPPKLKCKERTTRHYLTTFLFWKLYSSIISLPHLRPKVSSGFDK